MKTTPNPFLASQTLIKYTLYLNIIIWIMNYFIPLDKSKIIGIIIINVLLLLISKGLSYSSERILNKCGDVFNNGQIS